MSLFLRLLAIASICCSGPLAHAASKAEKMDRVVEVVLEREVRTAVPHRADDLAGALAESDRARWATGYVRTADGWQMFDAPATIDDRTREYEQRRGTEPLTPEQHLALANWCREQKLHEQERAHLWAPIASGRAHPTLWKRLGYTSVNGQWLSASDESRMQNRLHEIEQNFRVWLPRAESLKHRLSSSNSSVQATARRQLGEIDDIAALPAFEATFCTATPELASEFVAWAKDHSTVDSTMALARESVIAPWESIRYLAADALRKRRLDHFGPSLLEALATPIESRFVTSSPIRARGQIVFVHEFQRETLNTIQRGTYLVQAVGIGAGRMGRVRPARGAEALTDVENNLLNTRNHIDLQRAIDDELKIRQRQDSERNRRQDELNQRVSQSLSIASGFSGNSSPSEWWQWWHDLSATQENTHKKVVEVTEFEEYRPVQTAIDNSHSCLPAGTGVLTPTGLSKIETIRVGDRVLAKEIESGELSFRPVILTTVRAPQPLTTLHTKADSIRATLGHYFWVSGQGWRMAKEIKAGNRLHGVQGTVTVTDVSPGGREAVYNLVVEGANSYFVGESGILSHDVTPPVPTDIVVPGLAER